MKRLEQMTRADLIWMIRYIGQKSAEGDILIQRAMEELRFWQEQKRIDRAREAAERANAAHKRIIEILSPYDGMRLIDIPREAMLQAAEAEQEAAAADREWDRLMGTGLQKKKKEKSDHGRRKKNL